MSSGYETCYWDEAQMYPMDELSWCFPCNDLVMTCVRGCCADCGENTGMYP